MVQGRTENELETDPLLGPAIQFQLVIIGEACSTLEESTKSLMPAIPFSKIRSFRNRLVHGYFSVDPSLVWLIAVADVPVLSQECERTLEALFPETHTKLLEKRKEGS